MSVVFSRTFRSLWYRWLGWLLTAAFLLAGGIIVYIVNFYQGSTSLAYLYSILADVMAIAIPLLTCVTFTKPRKDGTEDWVRSLPISAAAWRIGVWLACFALLMIPTGLSAFLPLILSLHGTVRMAAAYTAWFGFFLHCVTILAIDAWIALSTKNRAVSILTGVGVNLILAFSDRIAGLMEVSPFASFAVLAVLFALIALAVFLKSGKWRLPASLTFSVPTVAALILAFAAPGFLTGKVPYALHLLSPYARLAGFLGGHFDVPAAGYGVTVTAFFLYLTVRDFRPRRRVTAERLLAPALALAVIAANVGLLFLPYRTAHPDVAGYEMYRLSDASRTALASVDEDVRIRYFSDGGIADVDQDYYSLVLQYAEASPHIRVEVTDIATEDALKSLSAEERSLADQAVIISSRYRSQLILRSDLTYYSYLYTYSDSSSSSTYSMEIPFTASDYVTFLQQYRDNTSSLYAIMAATSQKFAGESILTETILWAARETAVNVALIGDSPDVFLKRQMVRAGFDLNSLQSARDLYDCDVAFYCLSTDLTEDQAGLLDAYLTTGGKAVVTADLSSMTRLSAVVAKHGATPTSGIGISSDGNLVVFPMLLDVRTDTMYSGMYFAYFLSSMATLVGDAMPEGGITPEIAASDIPTEGLALTSSQATVRGVLLIAVLPLACLIAGGVAVYSRKKKTE